MAERTTKVTLTAQVSGYLAGMRQAQQATDEMSESAKKNLENQSAAFTELGTTALAFGAVAGAGVLLAVKRFADFDSAMSSVQAATHESAANMNLLRDAAIEAGSSTVFTAQQSANAIEELAKAGVSTQDILGGGLSGALDLASAGELKVADAAQIAATAMTQFSLSGSDVPHIADLLAAGAGKAQGSVEDLSQALNQGGLVASQTGLSIEETTGGLAAFASAGLIGSDAGTSFKTMLQRLTPQSAEAQAKMTELGISAYDANGQFIGLANFAGVLQNALKDLSPEARNSALSVIFGSDAVRAASVLYAQGAEGIQQWTDNVNDSGFAAETARLKLDNLNGDVEKLGGAFDTVLIKSGSAANDTLRFLTQTATNAVDAFGNLPPVFQGGALAIGVLVAGLGLLGGGFLTLVPKIAATRAAMSELNITGGRLAGIFGKGSAVLVGLTAVAAGFAATGANGSLAADEVARVDAAAKSLNLTGLNKQFKDGNGNVLEFKDALSSIASGNFFESSNFAQGIGGFLDSLTFGATDLTANVDKIKATFSELGKSLGETASTDFPRSVEMFKALLAQTDGSEESIRRLLEAMPEYKAALIEIASQQGKTASDQDLLNLAVGEGDIALQAARNATAKNQSALADMGAAAQDATGNISDLAAEIRDFGSAQLDANAAQRDFEQAVDDAADTLQKQKDAYQEANGSLEGFNASLDIGTQQGRDNSAALDGIASAANASAAAIYTQTGSQEAANGALDLGRQALIAQLAQFGITGQAAVDYANKIIATPKDITTQVILNGINNAQFALDQFMAGNIGRSIYINVRANLPDLDGAVSGSGRPGTFADGGAITGIGGPRSDNQMILASPGEHVFDARDVALMGGQSAVYAFRAALSSGRASLPRYADGGAVQPRYSSSGTTVVTPYVSLKGAQLVMSVDGRQMTAVIQDQIASAADQSGQTLRNGWSPYV